METSEKSSESVFGGISMAGRVNCLHISSIYYEWNENGWFFLCINKCESTRAKRERNKNPWLDKKLKIKKSVQIFSTCVIDVIFLLLRPVPFLRLTFKILKRFFFCSFLCQKKRSFSLCMTSHFPNFGCRPFFGRFFCFATFQCAGRCWNIWCL